MRWTQWFFRLCATIASKSKDPATKVGCVIVAEDQSIVSAGYNGFPRGVQDDAFFVPARYERPEKYVWTEHAERNAIYAAAKRVLQGSSMYLTWYPCADCARAIIQSGITDVYIDKVNYREEDEAKYPQFRFDAARQMLAEAGVRVHVMDIGAK